MVLYIALQRVFKLARQLSLSIAFRMHSCLGIMILVKRSVFLNYSSVTPKMAATLAIPDKFMILQGND